MCSPTMSDVDRLRELAAGLAGGLAADVAGDCGPASPAAAMDRAEILYAVIDRLEAAAAACVRTADAAGAARAAGYPSTTAWLRHAGAMLSRRASQRVAVARQLRRLPGTAARLAAGEIGYSTAVVITHAVKKLDDADTAAAEEILLDVAEARGPDAAAVAGRHIYQMLHPDGDLPERDKQFERRWLTIADLLDGMGAVDGLLDPELKAMLRSALEPLARPAGPDDTRTVGQRYADALHALLRSKQHTHLTVVVPLETLTGGSRPGVLPDGSPLPAADARRLAVDAGLSRVIVGPESVPLEAGRETRIATAAQRRALEVRDRQCVVDGCTIPAAFCEADHIRPWALGGRTDLANLALCCGFHNRYKVRHPDRVTVTRHPAGGVTYHIQRRRLRTGDTSGQSRDGPHSRAA